MSAFRTVLHDREIEKVATIRGVLSQLVDVADGIGDDVKARASGSATLRPLASRVETGEHDSGAWVGSDWGPLVPIEFGTSDTPGQRILLGAAEKAGRVEFR